MSCDVSGHKLKSALTMHVTQRLEHHSCDNEGFLLCRASNTDGEFVWHVRVWAQINTGQRHRISPLMDFTHFSPPPTSPRRQSLKHLGDPWGQPRCKNSFTRSFFSIHENVKRRASFLSHLFVSINSFGSKIMIYHPKLFPFFQTILEPSSFY